MEFRILGPLEAWADGERVDLGPHKQRALLALLLIHVDRVVPTDRILDQLWGDFADGKQNALWVHISRLRSTLEPGRTERGQSHVLLTRDRGYMIRSDPDTVDSRRFEAAVAAARRLIVDDPSAAAAALRGAIALWRGTALQDFTYDEFAGPEISRLEQLRLEALELRIDADLRRGLALELIGELESQVQQHPLRERPVAQLMVALYRAGRQADALARAASVSPSARRRARPRAVRRCLPTRAADPTSGRGHYSTSGRRPQSRMRLKVNRYGERSPIRLRSSFR